MSIEIRVLGPEEAFVLENVAEGVFDGPVLEQWSAEFFADVRHHLAVAIEGDLVVGMASGVHYVHPDKPPELWVNEIGVAPTHAGHGIGRGMLRALLVRGAELGCTAAWVLTEITNLAARRMYAGVGGTETGERPVLLTFALDAPESLGTAEGDDAR